MKEEKLKDGHKEYALWRKTQEINPDAGGFTEDQLIDAYLAGKQSATKLFKDKLKENIDTAGKQTKKIFEALNAYEFTPLIAALRINDYNNFDVLISVPENQFVSEEFNRVYKLTGNIEEAIRNDYRIRYKFINHSDSFDFDQLIQDGYFLIHKAIEKKAKSRKP